MMTFNRKSVLALCVLAIGLAGCQSARFSPWGTRAEAPPPPPPPLPRVPAGNVQASDLPPPGGFPAMPEQETTSSDLEVAANAPAVSQSSVVGSWKTSAAGSSCQMFLTLTKYGANSRGGTRGCPGELSGMRSWNVSGNQLQIYDENGSQIATLASTGAERFEGRTVSGQPVSLSR